MRQIHHLITIGTRGKGLTDCTGQIVSWLRDCGINRGLLNIFIRHTSASLMLQENADPDVLTDLETFFHRLVPEDSRNYRHTAEGPDDMPAHIRSALTQSQLTIPVDDGSLLLGTWQGIYLYEHRRHPHQRQIVLTLIGE